MENSINNIHFLKLIIYLSKSIIIIIKINLLNIMKNKYLIILFLIKIKYINSFQKNIILLIKLNEFIK